MVTVGTVEELKRKAPRHVKVEFSSPVTADSPMAVQIGTRNGIRASRTTIISAVAMMNYSTVAGKGCRRGGARPVICQ